MARAASEAGLTEEEAKAYLDERASEEDKSLRAFSDQALKVALKALTNAIKEKNRKVSHSTSSEGADGERDYHMEREAVIDVDAAKALLKAGMDARKLLKRGSAALGGGEPAGERDLFDRANPWSFKKTD